MLPPYDISKSFILISAFMIEEKRHIERQSKNTNQVYYTSFKRYKIDLIARAVTMKKIISCRLNTGYYVEKWNQHRKSVMFFSCASYSKRVQTRIKVGHIQIRHKPKCVWNFICVQMHLDIKRVSSGRRRTRLMPETRPNTINDECA